VNSRRVMAVSRKVLQSLRHDKRTAGFLVLMPFFMITIFGYTFGGEMKNVEVYVVNLDEGSPNGTVSDLIIAGLSSRDTLDLRLVNSVDVARQKVADAEAWAAIVFDADFSEGVMTALEMLRQGSPVVPSVVQVYMDATNPNIASAILSELQRSMQIVLVTNYNLVPPITVSQDSVYGEGAEFIDFFAPGVMGLAAMMVTFILSIISFVHERSTGTLDRLLTTPVTEGEIVAGYAIALGFVALIQSTVILVSAILLFQIQIEGSVILALGVILVLGIGMQGTGFLLSSIAKNEFQAIQFLPLILFPSILLAGVFWPLESVPAFLRPISDFIPLTYAVEALRSVMIRGWGLDRVWPDLTILVLFAFAMLALSTYGLKRRR